MISIKTRWERWYRWNCDLMVINARKKRHFFYHTESVAMTPKSCDHMPTTSLWEVAAKWPTQAPKTKTDTLPKRPTRIQPYQFEPVRQDFERVLAHRISFDMQYSMGFAKSHSLKCSPTQMGVMRHSKKVNSFELYKLNPLSPHYGSIARELVHCYTWGRLRIVTVRGNTVGRHS